MIEGVNEKCNICWLDKWEGGAVVELFDIIGAILGYSKIDIRPSGSKSHIIYKAGPDCGGKQAVTQLKLPTN